MSIRQEPHWAEENWQQSPWPSNFMQIWFSWTIESFGRGNLLRLGVESNIVSLSLTAVSAVPGVRHPKTV
jgi:hypothetical protein